MSAPVFRVFMGLIRLVTVPFPFALVTCFGMMDLIYYFTRPEELEEDANVGHLLKIFMIVAGTQAFVGIPSLLILDSKRAALRSYLMTGVMMALAFSAIYTSACMLDAPELTGIGLWSMFPVILVFFGLPHAGIFFGGRNTFLFFEKVTPTRNALSSRRKGLSSRHWGRIGFDVKFDARPACRG